jgi:pimeloyl-ACP methyl ester carboxylesterase
MMPRAAVDRWIDVAGLRIHYLTEGDGDPTVLLLHGGGVDAADFSFHATIPVLAERFQVLAPDWPGYGESASPSPGWAFADYVAFLGRFLDALHIERASLVGLSLGGGVALGFALDRPERVERLVLADSYGLGRELLGGAASYLFVHSPLNELSWSILRACGRNRSLARWTLRAALPCHPERATEDLVDAFIRLVRRPDAGASWRDFQRSETRWLRYRTDLSDRLSELRMPTLLVHGERDPAVPVDWSKRAQARIAGSRLAIIPESGHVTPLEQPEAFNRVVRPFLAGDEET